MTDIELHDGDTIKVTKDGKEVAVEKRQFGNVTAVRVPMDGTIKAIQDSDRKTLYGILSDPKGTVEHENENDPVDPAYSYTGLKQILEDSMYHDRAIRVKAGDVVTKFTVQEVEKWFGKKIPAGEKKKQQAILDEWLEEVQEHDSFENIIRPCVADYNWLGNGRLEVARKRNGLIGPIWHRQAETFRQIYDTAKKKDITKLVQIINSEHKVWFLTFGEKYKRKTKAWRHINPENGEDIKTRDPLASANEILTFKNRHPKDPDYGVPGIVSAIRSIKGNVRVRERNLNWFLFPIPAHLAVIQGANVDDDMKKEMEQYFSDVERGGKSLMLLGIPDTDTNITFKDFDTGVTTFPFNEYMLNNRDEILVADGVPPARVGVMSDKGGTGSGDGLSQMENYKSASVVPEQQYIESTINNNLLRKGLGVYAWVLRLEEADIRDKRKQSLIINENVRGGIMTQNEARLEWGLDRIEGTPEYDELVTPQGGQPRGMTETPKEGTTPQKERSGDETKSTDPLDPVRKHLLEKYSNEFHLDREDPEE